MKKFMFLHFGFEKPTPEIMKAWHTWFNSISDKQVDQGGFKGNFTSTLRSAGRTFQEQHGVTIVATGATEYKGREYGYGSDPRIITQLEFEALLAGKSGSERRLDSVIMIQCVGPAEKYCSRICCTTALKNALLLKRLQPEARVTILYRDVRAYGFVVLHADFFAR